MQTGKRGLFVLQDFNLHALGVFRDLLGLKSTRPEDTMAVAPAGSLNEALRAALECRKAEAYWRAQRITTHPR